MFEKEAEEIEIKADEYALEESTACNYGESSKHVYKGYFYGFKKGTEFGYNKAKEELQAQIEKMKCCGNCVHFDFTEPNYCHKGVYRANQNVCGEWEIKENDKS